MSEEKHTPLPWRVETIHSYTNGSPVEISIQSPDYEIAIIELDEDAEVANANAALIVRSVNALPALVKALEEVIQANDEFRAGMPEEWEGDPLQDACSNARAALTSLREEIGK